MAPAPRAKPTARTAGREDPDERMGARGPARDDVIRNRKGEPVALRFTGAEDKFHFDRSIIPDGWDYQWKTRTVKNWEWTEHQVELAQNGWEPVPADRHDGMFMPKGYKGPIERGGQILMERDIRLTQQARRWEKKMADDPVRHSRSQAGLASAIEHAAPGSGALLDLDHGQGGVKIERQARVPDRNYQYTLDE